LEKKGETARTRESILRGEDLTIIGKRGVQLKKNRTRRRLEKKGV